jgi:hypothetical protein
MPYGSQTLKGPANDPSGCLKGCINPLCYFILLAYDLREGL